MTGENTQGLILTTIAINHYNARFLTKGGKRNESDLKTRSYNLGIKEQSFTDSIE
jgi:hypothetical protein